MLRTLGNLALDGTDLRRPKPLLLLSYLALEGPTARRKLADLFFGETQDPNDSLTTSLKHLRQHLPDAVTATPTVVSTHVKNDVASVFEALARGDPQTAVRLYQGAFLATLKLNLGEELEDWVYRLQDQIAQRYRQGILEAIGPGKQTPEALALIEHAWRVTRDQEMNAETLGELYERLHAAKSRLTWEVQRHAAENGIPLLRRGFGSAEKAQAPGLNEPVIPTHLLELLNHSEGLRESTEGFALGLWGPAGIGKTWTVTQLKRALSFPLYTVKATVSPAQLVRSLPRVSGLPSWARTTLNSLQAATVTSPQNIVDAIATVLASEAPVVLHVEDLHEATSSAQHLWSMLADVVCRSPGVGLIVTSRKLPPDGFVAEKIPPLSHTEIALLLDGLTGSPLPAEVSDWIENRALGNPFFAQEYYRYLRKLGNVWHDGRAWRWRRPRQVHLPENLELLISQAIRSMIVTEPVKRFVQLRALLPAETALSLVAALAGLDSTSLRDSQELLDQQGIFFDGEFIHPLYREVQVSMIDAQTKSHLATQIVDHMADSAPEVAAYFIEDASLTVDRALSIITRAAAAAEGRGQLGLASDYLVQAATYALGTHRQVLLLRAANLIETVDTLRAQQLAERLLDVDPTHVEATFLLARCLAIHGDGTQADAILRRVPTALRPDRRWLEQLIHLRTERNDYAGVMALWEEAQALPSALSPTARRDIAFSLVHLGRMEEASGLLATTLRTPDIAREVRASLTDVQATIAFFSGKYLEALELLEQTTRAFRSGPADVPTLMSLFHALRFKAMCYWGLGENRHAIRETTEAMSIAADLGRGREHAIAQTYLGVPLTELGEYEEAEAMLLESREVLRRADAREHLAACEAMLSHVYIEWQPAGAGARALQHAYNSVDLAQALQAPVILSQATFYASWAESAFGDSEKARALAEQSITLSTEVGQQRNIASGLWARAMALENLAGLKRAYNEYEQAEKLFIDLGFSTYAALVGLNLDRFNNDHASARRRLEHLSTRGVRSMMRPARLHFPELFETFETLRLDL